MTHYDLGRILRGEVLPLNYPKDMTVHDSFIKPDIAGEVFLRVSSERFDVTPDGTSIPWFEGDRATVVDRIASVVHSPLGDYEDAVAVIACADAAVVEEAIR